MCSWPFSVSSCPAICPSAPMLLHPKQVELTTIHRLLQRHMDVSVQAKLQEVMVALAKHQATRAAAGRAQGCNCQMFQFCGGIPAWAVNTEVCLCLAGPADSCEHTKKHSWVTHLQAETVVSRTPAMFVQHSRSPKASQVSSQHPLPWLMCSWHFLVL